MQRDLYEQTSCVILSAGSSGRMGTHKALLAYDNERNFLQKIVGTYCQAGIEEVVVVVNTELLKLIRQANVSLPQNIKMVVNHKPGLGRFYSLQTGLKAITPGHCCFFQNIDNPFVASEVLEQMMKSLVKTDVVKPCSGNKSGHPALISTSIIQAVIDEPDCTRHIGAFLNGYSQLKIDIGNDQLLANINTQDDYRNAGFNL